MGAQDARGVPTRRVTIRALAWRGLLLALAVVGLYLVWPNLVNLFSQAPGLTAIHWYWFLLMVAVEMCSFACAWGLQRLTIGEKSWFLIATTQLASNAFSRVIPGGAASGGSVSYQLLSRVGVPRTRLVTALTATTLLSNAVLLALPVLSIPGILGGAPLSRSLVRAIEMGAVVLTLLLGVGALMLFTNRALHGIASTWQRTRNFFLRRRPPKTDIPETLRRERDLIRGVIGSRWWEALLFAAVNWLFDWAALLAALRAVGAHPHVSIVLIVYVVAALLGSLPFTPGGLGFVEVGLTALLPLAGVGAGEAALAALAYRLVSYWMPIPTGLGAYILYRRRYNGGEEDSQQAEPGPGQDTRRAESDAR